MTTWHDAGAREDLADGEMVGLNIAGMPVVLIHLDGVLSALHDLCTHGQARLSDGFLEGGCVECPLHQGLFDARTGAPRSAPVTEAVRSFPVRCVGERIEVEF